MPKIDQIPRTCHLITHDASLILERAGIDLDPYRKLRPSHWATLRVFAQQDLILFDDEEYGGPAAFRLYVDGVKPTYLKTVRRAGIISKFRKLDPADRRRPLWCAWLITPDMLKTVQAAVQALEAENRDNHFWTEPPGVHAERLSWSLRQTRNLRQRLMDLLAGQDDRRRSSYPRFSEGPMRFDDAEDLMGVLGLKRERRWYGCALAPTEPDTEHPRIVRSKEVLALLKRESKVEPPSGFELSELRETAMYIAQAVRNEMESFHARHLTDDQMRELNPIIRNAIYTALYAMRQAEAGSNAAGLYVAFNQMWPDYWEPPELTREYAEFESEYSVRSNGPSNLY